MIDTHAHLDFAEFDVDRDDVVLLMHSVGVDNLIIPVCRRSTGTNSSPLPNNTKLILPLVFILGFVQRMLMLGS